MNKLLYYFTSSCKEDSEIQKQQFELSRKLFYTNMINRKKNVCYFIKSNFLISVYSMFLRTIFLPSYDTEYNRVILHFIIMLSGPRNK